MDEKQLAALQSKLIEGLASICKDLQALSEDVRYSCTGIGTDRMSKSIDYAVYSIVKDMKKIGSLELKGGMLHLNSSAYYRR